MRSRAGPTRSLMNRVLVSLKSRTDPLLHPLLQIRPTTKELVLIISTDKGLAGALNTNLMREAAAYRYKENRLRDRRPQSAPIYCADAARAAGGF